VGDNRCVLQFGNWFDKYNIAGGSSSAWRLIKVSSTPPARDWPRQRRRPHDQRALSKTTKGDVTAFKAAIKDVADTCPACGVVGKLYRHGVHRRKFVDQPSITKVTIEIVSSAPDIVQQAFVRAPVARRRRQI
jgi:hypothetical protein